MRLLFVSLSLGIAALSLNGCGDDDNGGDGGHGTKGGSGGSTAGTSAGRGGGGTSGTGGHVERAGRDSGSAGEESIAGVAGEADKGGAAGTGGSAGNTGTPGTCEGFSQRLVDCSVIDKPIECASGGSDPSAPCYYGCYEAATCGALTDYYCKEATNSLADCLTACDTFTCGDGSTVPSFYTCDGSADCDDGADERGCVTAPVFQCKSGETVDGSDRCDGYDQCTDSSDEAGCPELTCPQPSAPTPGAACAEAAANLESCNLLPGGSMNGCLDRTEYSACTAECWAKGSCTDVVGYFCGSTSDGAAVQTCIDACDSVSDKFPCKTGGKSVPGNYVCDDVADCDDSSDEAGCSFKCATGGQNVSIAVTCDGYSDCTDGSDEAGCQADCSGAR
jgi:hypothetical protein